MTEAHVHVAVAIIKRGKDILLVYHPGWGAFTLPMTRIRKWGEKEEETVDAAARAAAECVGRLNAPVALTTIEKHLQIDLDGLTKSYDFYVYGVTLSDMEEKPAPFTDWGSAEDILNLKCRPISPTVLFILEALIKENRL